MWKNYKVTGDPIYMARMKKNIKNDNRNKIQNTVDRNEIQNTVDINNKIQNTVDRNEIQNINNKIQNIADRKSRKNNEKKPHKVNRIDFVPAEFEEVWRKQKDIILKPRILRSLIKNSLPYLAIEPVKPVAIANKKECHKGQIKLFITELQHLTAHIKSLDSEGYVIYAGSAPSMKAYVYAKLFPNLKFIFIDPNEFVIYMNSFHNTHYSYPGEDAIYMSVSKTNMNPNYTMVTQRNVCHYKDPKRVIDKNRIKDACTWDEGSMIDFIKSTNYRFYLFEEYMTKDVAISLNKLICDNTPIVRDKTGSIGGSFDLPVSGGGSYIKKKRELTEHEMNIGFFSRKEDLTPYFYGGKQDDDSPVLFWSDVRTNYKCSSYDTGDTPHDIDIIANAAMNYVWLKTLTKGFEGDFYSMLKFRLPYLEDDEIEWDAFKTVLAESSELGENYQEEFKKCKDMRWFQGDVYIQAFAAHKSAECRLWSNKEQIQSDLVYWPIKEHEDKLFYYNCIERFGCVFENDFADKKIGFDHCGDCAIESRAWSDFADKFYKFTPEEKRIRIQQWVVNIRMLTGRNLMDYPHGYNF